MTLQALREKIGDRTFFELLRQWLAANRHGITTPGSSRWPSRSRPDLDHFFQVWLYKPAKPTSWCDGSDRAGQPRSEPAPKLLRSGTDTRELRG